MKKLLTILSLLFIVNVLNATMVYPDELCSLYDHLYEVNQEWIHQDLEELNLNEAYYFKNESERIQKHLELVAQLLSTKPIPQLNPTQKANRAQQLQTLKAYTLAAQFPTNQFHQTRMPYFVDAQGTACAVAHLVLESGAIDLVNQIQNQQNYAFIRDMHYSELEFWTTQNGLTKEELALIQPTYGPIPYEWEDVGNGGGHNGEVMKMLSHSTIGLVMAGSFTEVDGVACQNIIARDDSGWNVLGGGVNGVVRDMISFDYNGQKLVVVGEFELFDNPGVPVNIAYWDDTEWIPLQTGDMEGSIYCIAAVGWRLFVGGDFKKAYGEPFSNLAKVGINIPQWFDHSTHEFSNATNVEHAFSTNGTVRTIFNNNGKVLIGGDFDEVGTLAENPDDRYYSKHIAGFELEGWKAFFDYDIAPVQELASHNNILYFASEADDELDVYVLENGFFEQFSTLEQMGDGKVHGFMATDNQCFMYGGVELNNRAGFVTLGWNYGRGAVFNGTVTAAVEHEGYTYVAGDFDESYYNVACNNLLKLESSTLTSLVDTIIDTSVQVYAYQKTVNVQTNTLFDTESISFYNTNGQLVKTHTLPNGKVVDEINMEALPVGIYVYAIATAKGTVTGKLYIGN